MTGNPREPDSQPDPGGPAQSIDIVDHERPSEAVVRAVAAATGRSVLDITPLFESIDPDALDALFDRLPDGTPRSPGRVVFPLDDCIVSVDGGEVNIRSAETGAKLSP